MLVLVPPIPVSHWDVGAAGAGGWAGMGTRTSRDGEGCPEHRNPLGFGVGVFLLSALLYPINLQNGKRKKKSSLAGKPRGKDPERARNSPSLPFYVPRDDWVAAAFNFCSAPAPCSSHCCFTCSVQAHLLTQHYFLIPQDSQLSGKASKELPVLVPKTCGSERAFLPPCCCLQTPPLAINHTLVVPGSGTGFFL